MNNILKTVGEFADEMLLFKTAYPKDHLREILNFDVKNMLDVTDLRTISKMVIVLGQYLITLTSQYNAMKVQYTLLNKEFKRKVKVAASKVKGNSVEERDSIAISNNEELKELEIKVEECRAKMDLLGGVDKSIMELINAFKVEINRRYKEREFTNKER